MKTVRSVLSDPQDSARPTPFTAAVDRLKQEHDRLKERVNSLYEQSSRCRGECENRIGLLQALHEHTVHLMKELDEHAEWEEHELFPALAQYFNRRIIPSITPSIWVMEKDHDLAQYFIQPILDKCDGILAKAGDEKQLNTDLVLQAKQAAADLMIFCMMLLEHFSMEEDLIFPLADEILTDLDSLYS